MVLRLFLFQHSPKTFFFYIWLSVDRTINNKIYMHNIILSNKIRIVVFYFCSYSHLFACLLQFLYLLIEVAVNKYWTNVFSLNLSLSRSHTYISFRVYVCTHRNMFFKNYVHKNNVVSFLSFTFIWKNMRKKREWVQLYIV